ncbi:MULTISPECIES: hypothetical protein [unclassified Coleofasciculus]|nr:MULTISPECIES: hypothetical protein [unclassified Coleofasciculus]
MQAMRQWFKPLAVSETFAQSDERRRDRIMSLSPANAKETQL